jgi:hypothetical protein
MGRLVAGNRYHVSRTQLRNGTTGNPGVRSGCGFVDAKPEDLRKTGTNDHQRFPIFTRTAAIKVPSASRDDRNIPSVQCGCEQCTHSALCRSWDVLPTGFMKEEILPLDMLRP